MGSIKSFKERLIRQSEKTIESAFQSKLNVDTSKIHGKDASSYNRFRRQNSRGGWNVRGRDTNVRGRGRNNFQRKGNDESTQQRCGICNRSIHVDKDCWFKEKPQYHNCNKFGHLKKDCKFNNNQQANFLEEKECDGNLFYACYTASEQKNDVWFLDSGCSSHMNRR